MKLQEKTIVVTGAGSGIGRELVSELLKRRARVAAVDINTASLAEVEERVHRPASLAVFPVDITDKAAVEGLPKAVEQRLGLADGLINCAGIIQPFVRFNDLDYAAIDRVFAVNFRGTLYMTKAFLPVLLKRPEGHIVNISSMGGFLPVPGQTIYGASKAAVKLMTEGLYAELASTSVHVTVVFPGAVATNIVHNSGVAVPSSPEQSNYSALPADRAARDILDGVERNRFHLLVGKDAKMMDALYRAAPKRATKLIARQMKNLLAAPGKTTAGNRNV